jgi:hypothetical protein
MKPLHNGEILHTIDDEDVEQFKRITQSRESLDEMIRKVTNQMYKMSHHLKQTERTFWSGLFKKYNVDPRCLIQLDEDTRQLIVIGIPDSADQELESWVPTISH